MQRELARLGDRYKGQVIALRMAVASFGALGAALGVCGTALNP
jgi:hypothetical protein